MGNLICIIQFYEIVGVYIDISKMLGGGCYDELEHTQTNVQDVNSGLLHRMLAGLSIHIIK